MFWIFNKNILEILIKFLKIKKIFLKIIDQINDPMPTKTEFTFEPQTLGLTPIIQQQINNPRKRKYCQELSDTTFNDSPNIQVRK